MKLVIARHCETDMNAAGRIQGRIDPDLNANGRAQAAQLAADVSGLGISRVVSSDLKRAEQTARIVTRALGVQLVLEPRLRECAFGTLDGITFAEFALRCGPRNLPTEAFVLAADFTPYGGERGKDVFERQRALLDDLKAICPHETVMIVGHGRALRTLLAPLGHPTSWLRTQGSYRVIDY